MKTTNTRPSSEKVSAAQRKSAEARPQSTQSTIVALLKRPKGSTIADVMKATGWQRHSVHGFFSGVVRRKLNLKLRSDIVGDKRVYRIVTRKGSKPVNKRPNRKARSYGATG